MSEEYVEKCFVCGVAFKPGDMILDDVCGEAGHIGCFGPEREGYVKDLDTGEPLGPDDAIPTGYPWEPLSPEHAGEQP